jgi:hypothetical protein
VLETEIKYVTDILIYVYSWQKVIVVIWKFCLFYTSRLSKIFLLLEIIRQPRSCH